MYHFYLVVKDKFLSLYRHFSDFLKVPLRVSISGAGLHIFPSLRRVFGVLNHKYIKWKCFLGIL